MNDSAPAVPAPALPVRTDTTALLTDFSDRLSPILVKELRQGLRQPTFVVAFLCLQVLLCIVVFVSVVSAPVGSQAGLRVGNTVSGFFFVLLAIAILVVQPLRGLNALATEIKADTLDLLLLTRLNSWRITFGKWLALVSQSALLVVAVFPYLILRYYLGGMQLFAELLALLTLFVASASLTGVAVGFSATASLVIRGLVGLGLLFATLALPNLVMVSLMRGSMGGRGGSPFAITLSTAAEVWVYAGCLQLLAFFGYYFLEMGATQIAPPAENRSTCKRVVGLATLGVLLWLLPNDKSMLFICWLLVSSLLIVDALSERPDFTTSVLRPFRRLGPLRYPAGILLLPGWASGIFFALLLGGITLALCLADMLINPKDVTELLAFVPLWFATLLYPAAVVAVFMRKAKNLFSAYMIVCIASLVVALVFLIIGSSTNTTQDMLLLVPLCPALGLMSFGEFSRVQRAEGLLFVIALLSCGVYWCVLFLRSVVHWTRIRAMDRALAPTPPAAVPPDPTDPTDAA
ncbi:MAG: hypothetical protein NTW21_12565 [Verrucomicrobia bacterium]|nr:hypothetical protein [Verrucomicrobiota bacterium]